MKYDTNILDFPPDCDIYDQFFNHKVDDYIDIGEHIYKINLKLVNIEIKFLEQKFQFAKYDQAWIMNILYFFGLMYGIQNAHLLYTLLKNGVTLFNKSQQFRPKSFRGRLKIINS
jgi:hypothetical protein